jgi:hypothetical protein
MTVMNTFISTTVQCARCHNHKFDPISQAEYYGLQAVFASTDKAERAYDPDAGTHALRQELLKKKSAIERKENSVLETLSEPSLHRELAAWEKSLTNRPIPWITLMPATFTSSGGATLAKQPDGSLLAGGTRPETDTYTITATTELKGITAVRLEVLSDPSLPHQGPGRQDNGNLHLTDFRMQAAPNERRRHGHPSESDRRFQPAGLGHRQSHRQRSEERLGHLSRGRPGPSGRV